MYRFLKNNQQNKINEIIKERYNLNGGIFQFDFKNDIFYHISKIKDF